MIKEYEALLNATDEELNNVIKALEGKGNFSELAVFLLASNEKLKRKIEKLEKVVSNQNEDTFW